jgi:hypothetical protein
MVQNLLIIIFAFFGTTGLLKINGREEGEKKEVQGCVYFECIK